MMRHEFKPTKVAVYFRVSTHRQDYALQKNAYHEWKSKLPKGDNIVFSVYEEKVSGKGKHRPKYELMMKNALDGKYDTIVTWKFDRLSRDFLTGLQQLIELVKKDIRVLFLDKSDSCLNDLQNYDRFLFMSIASFMMMGAQLERDKTSERIRAALLAKKEKEPSWQPGRKFGEKRKYDDDQIDEVVKMREQTPPVSWAKIHKLTGIPPSSGYSIYKRAMTIKDKAS